MTALFTLLLQIAGPILSFLFKLKIIDMKAKQKILESIQKQLAKKPESPTARNDHMTMRERLSKRKHGNE